MRAVYPAWAHMMPAASYRHNILVLLVAAVVGAISSATVVLFLVGEPSSATGIPMTSVRVAVMREPAATDRALTQDGSEFEQMPQPKIEQMPQSVPDDTVSYGATAGSDAGPHIAMPGEGRAPDDLPVAAHQPSVRRRFGHFPTPNHW
jgi:hypothetical protein